MKKCVHCGLEPLDDRANFCPRCGWPASTPNPCAESNKKPGVISTLLIAYLYTFLFSLAIQVCAFIYVISTALITGSDDVDSLITIDSSNIVTMIIYCLIFGIAAAVLLAMRRSPLQTAGIKRVSPSAILLGALFGYSANLLYSFGIGLIPWSESLLDDHTMHYGDVAAEGSSLILTVLATALFTGIAEEIVFRGLVMKRLRKSFGPAATVMISAVFFGIAHPTLISFTYSLVLGLFLGMIFIRYDSILPCIAAHVFFNLAACIGYPENPLLLIGMLFICAAFYILSFYLLTKQSDGTTVSPPKY